MLIVMFAMFAHTMHRQALEHPYFTSLPAPCPAEDLPTPAGVPKPIKAAARPPLSTIAGSQTATTAAAHFSSASGSSSDSLVATAQEGADSEPALKKVRNM